VFAAASSTLSLSDARGEEAMPLRQAANYRGSEHRLESASRTVINSGCIDSDSSLEQASDKTLRLYHFLGAHWAADDLAKTRLKISRFDDLNDPFELLAPELKDPVLRKAFLAVRDHMCAKRGVLCFSRSWSNPLLWSHYADKHRGVCLGFDVPETHIVRVRYDSKRLVNVLPQLLAGGPDSEALMARLLVTKFHDWKYEDEVRIHTDLKDADPATNHYYKDFAQDLSLKEVILGPRFAGNTMEVVASARACFADVSMICARLAFTKFRVVPNKSRVI
jgi:hypothetical protein